MTKYYVSVNGLGPQDFAFIGLYLASEDHDFARYVDAYGNDYIIDKSSPFIYLEDVNDAQFLKSRPHRVITMSRN